MRGGFLRRCRAGMAALVYAFWLPRGRGRACPALNINHKQVLAGKQRAGYARPLHLSNIFYHAATVNVPGTVKTVPYKAPVNPICREGS